MWYDVMWYTCVSDVCCFVRLGKTKHTRKQTTKDEHKPRKQTTNKQQAKRRQDSEQRRHPEDGERGPRTGGPAVQHHDIVQLARLV